jgi:hypothetical protein
MDDRLRMGKSGRLGLTMFAKLTSALALAACGSVTPLSHDGGTGQAGQGSAGQGAAGQGSAGQGSAGQGAAGQGEAGTSGAGHGGGGQAAGGGGSGEGGAGGARDGGTDTANTCRGLTQAQCTAMPDCAVATCANCSGGASYIGCYRPSTDSPPQCPVSSCPPKCAGLTEAACTARADCRADYCPGCQQAKSFVQCALPSDPQPACPAIACIAPCAQVTTLPLCEARTDCHSVFVDPGTCGCAAKGCCAHFSRCADGDKAQCAGMPLCKIATPYCEAPYVVSFTASCYEGCVNQKDCAP